MKRPELLIAVLMALVSPALAFNEPDSFLDVKWGDTPDAAREIMWKRDGNVSCESGVYGQCAGETTIGDVKVSLLMMFHDGRVSGVSGFFPSHKYRVIRAMFVERYGQPAKTETARVAGTRTRAIARCMVDPPARA